MDEIIESSPTFRLCGLPNLAEAVGSIVDIFGAPPRFNTSASAAEADYQAIKADWEAVGEDMRAALERFHRETAETNA